MKKMFLVAAVAALPFFATDAEAKECKKINGAPIPCRIVGDINFGGGKETPVVVPTKACLRPDLYEAIRLNDGSSKWQAGYYYKPGHGQEVITIKNSPCWEFSKNGRVQNMPLGYMAIAFINCPGTYVGWVGAKITGAKVITLVPVNIDLDPN